MENTGKYFLFEGKDYTGSCGMFDFKGSYATLEEAQAAWDDNLHWGHIATVIKGNLTFVSKRFTSFVSPEKSHWIDKNKS